ncbi:cell adhesion molecule DSCAML1-like [Frankliniella occidentalis]|uniref:Cell adhesion molecule DSCAML1-like n=1 Tax=Frankliniella occidentalis TaxID=133901 RepID=A0A9C6X533_FRAOC|nr:cell adhesion molecule DSCAML1-like [Frankliniella occidentalis]
MQTLDGTIPCCVVSPVLAALSFGDDPVNAGDAAAVQCSVVKGDMPVNITWSKDGKVISNGDDGVDISKAGQRISTLAIEPVAERHRGTYKCTASNRAGAESQSARLDVLGRVSGMDRAWLQ